MWTDLKRTALAYKRGVEVDWVITATKGDFLWYDFQNERLLGLEKVSLKAGRRA